MNTAHKRFSAMLTGLSFRPILPVPASGVDAADRLVFMFLYSGIAAAAPSAPTGVIQLQTLYSQSFTLPAILFLILRLLTWPNEP